MAVEAYRSSETLAFDDPVLAGLLFGPRNSHLVSLGKQSGAHLDSCGSSLIIHCNDPDTRNRLCNLFTQFYALLRQGYALSQPDLLQGYAMLGEDPALELGAVYRDAVFLQSPRKSVTARNLAQKRYLYALRGSEMVFAVGPAGTGKTYLAVAMAVAMFLQNRVKRIVLTRPAVEAGERLGFLPGDLAEKVNPYLRPLYDALHDMLPQPKVASMLETSLIEVAPLAFMRGRTLNDAFIILDEAQNTTQEQMKMFLTRLGMNSRAAITGDITQIDLPAQAGQDAQTRSGLVRALNILAGVRGVSFIHFTEQDVVRHPLVSAIVGAYDAYENSSSAN
ncbi:MAG: PhoH family protein [Deltaproteobacteria bacterium]|jgi:phosphate starvation-inducible PhoH-like protein|nr:PhoH family protein [Deltaproteobacteria bacterium]